LISFSSFGGGAYRGVLSKLRQ